MALMDQTIIVVVLRLQEFPQVHTPPGGVFTQVATSWQFTHFLPSIFQPYLPCIIFYALLLAQKRLLPFVEKLLQQAS